MYKFGWLMRATWEWVDDLYNSWIHMSTILKYAPHREVKGERDAVYFDGKFLKLDLEKRVAQVCLIPLKRSVAQEKKKCREKFRPKPYTLAGTLPHTIPCMKKKRWMLGWGGQMESRRFVSFPAWIWCVLIPVPSIKPRLGAPYSVISHLLLLRTIKCLYECETAKWTPSTYGCVRVRVCVGVWVCVCLVHWTLEKRRSRKLNVRWW